MRELFEQADKLVHSALKIARKNELSALQLELNEWKERILESLNNPAAERYELLNANYSEMKAVLSSIQNEKEIAFMKWSWFAGYYTNGQPRKNEEHANNEQLLSEIEVLTPISLEAQIKSPQLKGAILLSLGKPSESLQSLGSLLQLLEHCELNGNENKNIQRNALANAAVISAQLKNVKEAANFLSQLESCFEENENNSLVRSTALTIFSKNSKSLNASFNEFCKAHQPTNCCTSNALPKSSI